MCVCVCVHVECKHASVSVCVCSALTNFSSHQDKLSCHIIFDRTKTSSTKLTMLLHLKVSAQLYNFHHTGMFVRNLNEIDILLCIRYHVYPILPI